MIGPRERNAGVALISVLMIMLVLSLMAAYLIESLSTRLAGASVALVAAETDAAAISGLEWGRQRALQSGQCASSQLAIGTVTVGVNCSTLQVTEDAASYPVYRIVVVASRGTWGDQDHVRRTRIGRYALR